MIEILLLALALLLVVLCGLFVAAEFAFVTVDRSTVDRAAEEGDRSAQGIQKALRSLSTMLSGSQVGITLTNLGIGFLAEPSLASLLEGPLGSLGVSEGAVSGVALAIGFVLANVITMVFGELVPKNLAIAHPLGTSRKVQGFQRGFTVAFGPLIRASNASANWILRRLGIEPQEELASARSAEELVSLARRSAEQGTLELPTAELLEKSIEFGERHADDVMTPRVRVSVLAPDSPVVDVIEAARESGRSRFPVVEEGSERVEGVVHVKHAVAVPWDERSDVPIQDVMAKPVMVPSSMELDPLLTELRKVGLQIAVVVDEFGSFDGIVTLEDLIEEIIGEVRDEHDPREEPLVPTGDGSWRLSGLLRPDEIFEATGVQLPEDTEYETVAGLIAMRLGRVPGQSDTVRVEARGPEGEPLQVGLAVIGMDGLRVDRVRMRLIEDEMETGELLLP